MLIISWGNAVLGVALLVGGTLVGELIRRRGRRYYLLILPATLLLVLLAAKLG